MIKERTCTRCGDNYMPETSRQQVCSKEHFKSCKNCGNDYPWGKRGVTCSPLCATALRKQSGSKFECVWCKEEFTSNNPRAMYCDRDHYSDCEKCGVSFVVASVHRPSKTCSSSCASALTHTEEADAKRKATSLERFGTEHPFQNDEIKAKIQASLDSSEKDMRFGSEKFQKTISEKYGVENASQIEEVKAKKAATSLKNYGVDNPMKSELIRKKQNDSTKENNEGRTAIELASEGLKRKYGHDFVSRTHMKNTDDWEDFAVWAQSKYNETSILLSVDEVAKYFNAKSRTIRKLRHSFSLYNIFEPDVSSKKEKALSEHLSKMFPNTVYVKNARKIIDAKELDFYFPDHKFAVEISPTSTHASDTLAFGGNCQKDKDYHRNKAVECEKAGIELLTIFDWMPWNKVLSMIEHKLKGSQRVFARKCSANFVQKNSSQFSRELKNFIADSHVLGFNPRGTTHYTYLTYEGEIVGAAAWGAPRNLSVRSSKSLSKKDAMELIRMCFKPGIAVTGGASKLLKAFVRNYEDSLNEIVTFSDYDLGWGNIYSTLGFDLVQKPTPQLNYAHPHLKTGDIGSEIAMRVKNTSLHLAGADRLLSSVPDYVPVGMSCVCVDEHHPTASCLPSNIEIVQSYGFLSIWDCGYKKWILSIENN